MKSYFVLVISIFFFSCNKKTIKETENNFYYPNKETVIKYENSAKLDFEIFKNTEELLDSLSILNYEDKKAIFHFKESSNNYYIIPDYLGHPEGSPPAVKLKKIIELSYDSISKLELKYSIDSLPMVLKADQKKFGNNTYLSDSPINTHILLYDSIHKIKKPLIKLLETIDQINFQAKDSLKFKIIFSDYFTRMKKLEKQLELINDHNDND